MAVDIKVPTWNMHTNVLRNLKTYKFCRLVTTENKWLQCTWLSPNKMIQDYNSVY